jgi:hypothetical protein
VFKSRPGIPAILRFVVVFFDPWRQYLGEYLMLGRGPLPLHLSPIHFSLIILILLDFPNFEEIKVGI